MNYKIQERNTLLSEAKKLIKAIPRGIQGLKSVITSTETVRLLTFGLIFIVSVILCLSLFGSLETHQAPLVSDSTNKIITTPEPSSSPTSTQNAKIISPIPTIDSDPVVNCSLNEKCGGGSISVRRSECSNTTCCEIAGKWVVYKDENQCTRDQQTYWNNYYGSGNNYVAPTYAPLPIPTYSSPTYSAPAYVPHPTSYPTPTPNYSALLQDCINQANDEYNSTMSALRGQGMADSSSAVVAEQKRNSKIQQCHNLYGN